MAQVTVYADTGIVVDVKAGTPPVDQSAEVATLTQQLADANAMIVTLNGTIVNKDAVIAGQLTSIAALNNKLITGRAKAALAVTATQATVTALA